MSLSVESKELLQQYNSGFAGAKVIFIVIWIAAKITLASTKATWVVLGKAPRVQQ